MDPAFAQQMHQLLEACLSPDTAVIKHATAELALKYYKSSMCLPALFEIATTSPNQGVRQLGATELRKRVYARDGKLWAGVPAEWRQRIKSGGLDRLLVEEAKIVRHSLARALAAISDFELSPSSSPSSSTSPAAFGSGWPELLPFLSSQTQSPNAAHREVSIFMLYSILDTIAEHTFGGGAQGSMFIDGLFSVCGKGLLDEDVSVRGIALKAMGKIAEWIETEHKEYIKQYQALIPTMLQVTHATVQTDDVDASKAAFDVFETLLILDVPLINKHIREYTELCLVTAANTGLDDDIRCASFNSLTWLIQYKKSKVLSLGLAKPIIDGLLPIGCEDEREDEDEDYPSKLAFRALDELAKALPPSQVFPILLPRLQEYMGSPDPTRRKAALMSFGVIVEGVSEYIRPHIEQLWPLVDQGLRDPEPLVRKAGCVALACMCDWLTDECAARHAVFVPILFDLVSDPATQKSAVGCLESYLETLHEDIGQYITLIMERLVILLENSPIKVQITVTGAIGSAAFAAKEGFKPYFSETARRIIAFLTIQGDEDEMNLRSAALDALGTFADVVGKEDFRPYFPELMTFAINSLDVEKNRMKESAFLFFATMSKVFQEEYEPYLALTVPKLIESCEQEEGEFGEDDSAGGASVAQAVAAFNSGTSSTKINENGDEDDEDDDIEDLDKLYGGVNSEVAIEKEVATEVIGQIFEGSKAAFLPYLHDVTKVLLKMMDHYYEGIRRAAFTSLFTIVRTYHELMEDPEWRDVAHLPAYSQDMQTLADMIMPKIVEAWNTEDDKQTVITICSELAQTLNTCGPRILEGRKAEVLTNLKALLEQTADCQLDLDLAEGENEELGETSEYDSVLISNTIDVVATLCGAYGPAFVPEYAVFFPLCTKYYSADRSTGERSMTIGSLGESIVGLKGGVTQFTQPILAILSRALHDQEAEVRSNAAFAAGSLIEWSEADLTGQYLPLLGALQPYFAAAPDSSKDNLTAKDNAVGALSRMIKRSSASLPLDRVLPIFIDALPLMHDRIENKPAFEAIFHLFETNPSAIMPHVEKLLLVFKYVLDPARPDDLQDDTKDRLIQLIHALAQQMPQQVAAAGLLNGTA